VAAANLAASVNRPLVLWGDSAVHGATWLQALLGQVRAAVPAADVEAALDCGDRAGDALAALRTGIVRLGWSGSHEVAAKLQALGAVLVDVPAESAPGIG
jgi:hypothetical protein